MTGTKVTYPKTVLDSSLGEDVGFKDNFFSMTFNDTYGMIRPMVSFWAITINKKCKHLSNLPTVTLLTLC
jgi:hypothetical protein